MCWNLYIWMLVEANLVCDYKELPTQVAENGVNGKASPEHSTRFVSAIRAILIINTSVNDD